jgi:hypothetical protein
VGPAAKSPAGIAAEGILDSLAAVLKEDEKDLAKSSKEWNAFHEENWHTLGARYFKGNAFNWYHNLRDDRAEAWKSWAVFVEDLCNRFQDKSRVAKRFMAKKTVRQKKMSLRRYLESFEYEMLRFKQEGFIIQDEMKVQMFRLGMNRITSSICRSIREKSFVKFVDLALTAWDEQGEKDDSSESGDSETDISSSSEEEDLSESESSSSCSSDSEDNRRSKHGRKRTKRKPKKAKKRRHAKDRSAQGDLEQTDEISKLTDQMKQLQLFLTSSNQYQPKDNFNSACHNCREVGHRWYQCVNLCKGCTTSHIGKDCPVRIQRRNDYYARNQALASGANATPLGNPGTRELNIIETSYDSKSSYDLLLHEMREEGFVDKDLFLKRKSVDGENSQPVKKRVNLSRDITEKTTEDIDTQVIEAAGPSGISKEDSAGVEKKRKPALKRNPNPLKPLTGDPLNAESILSNKCIQVSVLQLADISGKVHTELKKLLTKSSRLDPDEAVKVTQAILTMSQKQGGAPRTMVRVTGPDGQVEDVLAILDPGAAENIVTTTALKRWGYKRYDTDTNNVIFTLGDGKKSEPLGTVKNMRVELRGEVFFINAFVMEHDKYDLLLCMDQLGTMGIGCEFRDKEWWIRLQDGNAAELSLIW